MKRSFIVTLLIFWALIFLGHSWEAGLKMDAMTYGALAKNILRTGDWKTLHYTPSAYADFYQHPPLAIWIQAVFFKILGASDLTARIFPALCGLGTVAGVFLWGALFGNPWWGFLAGFVLLTSGRYIKFATDFFLDGPLALFLVWGGLSFLLAMRSRPWIALCGLCMGAAFMTKGLAGLALPITLLGFAVVCRPKMLSLVAIASAVGAVLVLIWVGAADGGTYIQRYWAESVGGRLGISGDRGHHKPLIALLKTYWPWLPVFMIGLIGIARKFRRTIEDAPLSLAAAMSVGILSALVLNGYYLDHYLVPFYPFAALIAAKPLSLWLSRIQDRVERNLRGLAVGAAVLLAVLPVSLHYPRGEPLKGFVRELQARCRAPKRILVSRQAMDRWMALAVVLWETSSDAVSIDRAVPAREGDLMILAETEGVPAAGWSPVRIVSRRPLKAYQFDVSPLCPADS